MDPRAVVTILVSIFTVTVHGRTPAMLPQYDTIVVGLGSAGCTAASTLAQAGKRVLGLEAQGRIGGRVNTVPFGDGLVELGAEWIHGTEQSRVYDLAIKNNASVISQSLDFEIYRSNGSTADKELINELVTYALDVTVNPPPDAEPLGQFTTRKLMEYIKSKHPALLEDQDFVQEFLHFMDLLVDNIEASNSWNDVTTDSRYEELGGDQHMSWHRHGYKTFFDILLNTYNNGPGYPNLEVKLNTEVTKIIWPQDPKEPVVVQTTHGSHTAKSVIVTVSLGVLKERHTELFSPPLPAVKINAIDNISFGVVVKIILAFTDTWWPQASWFGFLWNGGDRGALPLEDTWVASINGPSVPTGSNNTLTLWSTGDAAKMALFSPPLPRDKAHAIDNISIGIMDKIILAFDRAWWPMGTTFFAFVWNGAERASVGPNDEWTTKVFGASTPLGSNLCLTIWTSGENAKLVETLPEDVVKRKSMELLRRFMGAGRTIPEPIAIIRSNWYSNPYTRGSYTYDNIRMPQHPTARVDLAEPLTDSSGKPRVLFAGEATSSRHFSTVHGAADTGYREAMRLLPASNI